MMRPRRDHQSIRECPARVLPALEMSGPRETPLPELRQDELAFTKDVQSI
ncbi:hypothetical protein PF003_g13477 [Phytophthora fragariae]|nr:hypothetical protein PF003_g13477 [Phytophthora fragariae]